MKLRHICTSNNLGQSWGIRAEKYWEKTERNWEILRHNKTEKKGVILRITKKYWETTERNWEKGRTIEKYWEMTEINWEKGRKIEDYWE